MSSLKPDQSLTFYPAYCYPASPTYFIWVKLTSHDIHHALHEHPSQNHHHQHSPSGTNLYFYLNHPIQFIQLTGIIVAIEDYHPHIFLFTLDDSSGSTIDIILRKPKDQNGTTTKVTTDTPQEDPSSLLPLLQTLQIGQPILAKGTLTTFRSTLQLNLLRLNILTPSQELRLISSRTQFLLNTLSKPWSLSKITQTKLLQRATGETQIETQRAIRARKRRELIEKRERTDDMQMLRQHAEDEKRRGREAEVARQEGVKAMRVIEERRKGKRNM